jgi:PIN domain nuclease of toxin-antitoxin system
MSQANVVVIDTHALIWYLEEDARLSVNATLALDRIGQDVNVGFIPTIALAELMHISEKGRTGLEFRAVLTRLEDIRNLGIASFDLEVLTRMLSLDMFELHDRIIVATALSHDARLVTRDRAIRNSGVVECIW